MIIDMNYWTKVLKRIVILLITIFAIYIGLKMVVFYMPFLIAFIISLLIEPIIRFFMKKIKLKRKTSSIFTFIIVLGIIVRIINMGNYDYNSGSF